MIENEAALTLQSVTSQEEMQHAMAKQAQIEREQRAKVIHTEDKYQASQCLADFADKISTNRSYKSISTPRL